MKTILQRLMCMAVAAMACMSVNAQNNCGTDDHEADVTWELNGSQLIFSGAVEIKTYSNENPSAYPWYNHASNIQTVIIGEGITNIPAWAFAMYENLRSIHLPSTLKTIGWSCLEETNLWNVSLPEGLETIEGYAFMMTPFSTVSIPSTVKEIGERAFGYCENLVSIGCYADKPPTLGSNAFGDSPIETVYVKSAKISTYKDTAGWKNFGDKIQSPAGYCGPNGSDDDGDDDITKATWSFDMATRTLTIEGTKMGQYNRPWESAGMGGSGGGFNPDNNVGYPQGICHIVIGEGITVIPADAFYMEVGVTDVVLPSTLESIGMQTFGENFNLTTVTINATTPPTFGEDMFSDCPKLAEIIVPSTAVDSYKAAAGWSTYADKIVAGGDIVAGNAVDGVYWATYYNSAANMKADANTTVYKAAVNGSSLTLTEIDDKVINAGEAVILKSTGANVSMITQAAASADDYSGNALEGVNVATAPAGGYKYYVLSNEGSTLGFYHYTGATLGANKAFIKVANSTAPEFYAFDFSGEATGINKLNVKRGTWNGEVYNLAGQRVAQPTKGLYIVNGKKVVIK